MQVTRPMLVVFEFCITYHILFKDTTRMNGLKIRNASPALFRQ